MTAVFLRNRLQIRAQGSLKTAHEEWMKKSRYLQMSRYLAVMRMCTSQWKSARNWTFKQGCAVFSDFRSTKRRIASSNYQKAGLL